MQIILVQTEVEQALRNYVASRLTLAEGTTFSIDLAATRGVNGITATIDLVEPGQSTAAPAGSIPRALSTKPAAAPTMKPASEVQADPATQASAAQENAATAQETGSAGQEAETGPLADGQVVGAAEAVAEEVPAEKPKSLFGGLQRPKNA